MRHFGLLLLVYLLPCSNLMALDQLTIVSPHRKSMQQEFIPKFKEYYKQKFKTDINVEWITQGGASDDLRLVLSKFEKNSESSGLDIFWGGGEHGYIYLDKLNLLTPMPLSAELKSQIPQKAAGISLYNDKETWHASAMTCFGIFYNRLMLEKIKAPIPNSWQELGTPTYWDNLSNADPRHSSSFLTLYIIILQSLGWEKGWEALTTLAANTRKFTHSSTDPIKNIVSGEATAGLSIGYFANAKIDDLGEDKVGYKIPEGQTIINADPIAILKGAPNTLQAQRFIEYILNADTQKILILPLGAKGGPTVSSMGRMSINQKAYTDTVGQKLIANNPFQLKYPTFVLDIEGVAKMQFVFADLLGALLIDQHRELKAAWKKTIDRGNSQGERSLLSAPPLVEKDLYALADKWSDSQFRNEKMQEWGKWAKEKYTKIVHSK